jgi:GNAT superfamily N-acetyltransferase
MEILVRPFEKQDVDHVFGMIQALCAFHGDVAQTTKEQLSDSFFEQENLGNCLVACADNNIVGFAITYDRINFIQGKRMCCVDLVFVSEKMRSTGIGSILIKECAREALKRNCTRFDITATNDNDVAHNFYKKLKLQGSTTSYMRYKLLDNDLKNFCMLE